MKIAIAKTAGFCMGVRRAVEMVLAAPHSHRSPIYTFGPLIHNPQVLKLLAAKNIGVLEDIPDQGRGTVLIRAHGVPPDTKTRLEAAGFNVIDATCPRVIKVQTIIRKYARRGCTTIIVGDRDHPEVVGLLGYTEGRGHVVSELDDIQALPRYSQAIIVAQTTQNRRLFAHVATWTRTHHPHYQVFNTICDSTTRRQVEVERLATSVDAVIVVGGHNSGNTQRLAEIAGATGKPVYAIETETELNAAALAEMQSVGITAGASTPNWVIKRVYRSLESLLFQRQQAWRRWVFNCQRTLLLAGIYLALGAGCLCYACARLQEGIDYFPHVFIAMLYVHSMHILNHLTGNEADNYNDPERALFYRQHNHSLGLLAIIAGGAGLVTAFYVGRAAFMFLLAMSLLGLSYNLRMLPLRLTGLGHRRIRDIPGSKTVLIAVAWGMVTALLPALSTGSRPTAATVLVFGAATALVFTRTVFFDALDMQGDRIVGKATIPLLLGKRRTGVLLKSMLAIVAVGLTVASLFGWITSLGLALVLCPVFMGCLIYAYEKGALLPGIHLEFLVETHFVLAGLIAVVYSIL